MGREAFSVINSPFITVYLTFSEKRPIFFQRQKLKHYVKLTVIYWTTYTTAKVFVKKVLWEFLIYYVRNARPIFRHNHKGQKESRRSYEPIRRHISVYQTHTYKQTGTYAHTGISVDIRSHVRCTHTNMRATTLCKYRALNVRLLKTWILQA